MGQERLSAAHDTQLKKDKNIFLEYDSKECNYSNKVFISQNYVHCLCTHVVQI